MSDDGVRSSDVKPSSSKELGGAGVLGPSDIASLRGGVLRVAKLMGDGKWHTAEEIREAAGSGGVPASEGLRRLRELRKIPGATIERRSTTEGSRAFVYRLEVKRPEETYEQNELFGRKESSWTPEH